MILILNSDFCPNYCHSCMHMDRQSTLMLKPKFQRNQNNATSLPVIDENSEWYPANITL